MLGAGELGDFHWLARLYVSMSLFLQDPVKLPAQGCRTRPGQATGNLRAKIVSPDSYKTDVLALLEMPTANSRFV